MATAWQSVLMVKSLSLLGFFFVLLLSGCSSVEMVPSYTARYDFPLEEEWVQGTIINELGESLVAFMEGQFPQSRVEFIDEKRVCAYSEETRFCCISYYVLDSHLFLSVAVGCGSDCRPQLTSLKKEKLAEFGGDVFIFVERYFQSHIEGLKS